MVYIIHRCFKTYQNKTKFFLDHIFFILQKRGLSTPLLGAQSDIVKNGHKNKDYRFTLNEKLKYKIGNNLV